MNNRYLRRSAKYFATLIVLCVVVVTVLCATGLSAVPFGDMGHALFHTWRGGLLFLMAAGMAAAYPISGFVRREAAADIDEDRDSIVQTFAAAGFVLTEETAGVMKFRAATPLRRLRLLLEDEIEVTRGSRSGEDKEGTIVVDGIRRVAVPVALRIEAAARHSKLD